MESFSSLIDDIALTYTTDTIFILGKGPSADAVRPEILSSSLVIGLNDAERIAPVDITLFHAEWVLKGLAESGYRSRLYVTSVPFSPPRGQLLRVPHHALTQESADLVMQRLLTDEIAVEDILFLSALKLARMVAKQRGRTQTVYMIGFDFTPNTGQSRQIGTDYAPHPTDERETRILLQENYFLNALYFLQNSEVTVKHVGTRAFSSLSPDELNAAILGPAARLKRAEHRVKVVAELTTNHFGDRKRLERMVRAATAAGADYIKLQKRDVATFYSKEQLASSYRSPFGPTFGDYRYGLELSHDDFVFVDELCRQLGVSWFASLLDKASFDFMMQFNPDLVKLPSTISEHTDYLAAVANNFDGGIVLSTGMTDQSYERWVLETFIRCPRLYLMQANSAYPTPLNDCNIGVVRHYDLLSRRDPRIIPAYSSHDLGTKASTMAVAAGARMVEKHVKFGNAEWAHFDAVAVDLTTPAFKEYVDAVREAELIVGEESKKVNPSEHHKYRRGARAA